MTTHRQFLRNKYIELDCEQNASLLKKLKMWFSQESNLAPHIKKGTRWHFFFWRLEGTKYMRKHYAVASVITKISLQSI